MNRIDPDQLVQSRIYFDAFNIRITQFFFFFFVFLFVCFLFFCFVFLLLFFLIWLNCLYQLILHYFSQQFVFFFFH